MIFKHCVLHSQIKYLLSNLSTKSSLTLYFAFEAMTGNERCRVHDDDADVTSGEFKAFVPDNLMQEVQITVLGFDGRSAF